MISVTGTADAAPFDWVLFWAIIAGVVGILALVGVVYAVVGYYRDHPKRQLEYTVRSRRLVQSTPKATLEVRVNGIDVPDPHLVEFRMIANSRADIPSSAFDAGRKLTMRVQPGGAFVLRDAGQGKGITVSGGTADAWDWAEFDIEPQLIRKKATLALDFISSGKPTLTINSSLVDVPVVNVSRKPSRGDIIMAWFVLVLGVAMAAVPIINPIANPGATAPLWVTISSIFFALLLSAGGIALLRETLSWREKRT